jgi:GDP-4-dehydro-6-deoxy-D-mannose reductase
VRILVTGISGFLGRHLAEALRDRGDEVFGTFVGPAPGVPGITAEEVEILDGSALLRLLATWQPEVIIHLAALAHVGSSWQALAEYHRVNVLGTEVLLQAAGGRRVVFASSAEVYGLVPESEQPIDEDRVVAPASPYALTKAAAELLVLARGGVVARCFNMVGPGQSPTFALPAFAHQLRKMVSGEQEKVLKVGNLTARRDFVHVRDGVLALMVLAEKAPEAGVFNVASGQAWSIADALKILVRISGLAVTVEEEASRLRPVDIPLLLGRSQRLRALGWEPQHSLREALSELWETARSQG